MHTPKKKKRERGKFEDMKVGKTHYERKENLCPSQREN
jgi:hypothetical protein